MKRLKTRQFLVLVVVLGILLNFVINRYNVFAVINSALAPVILAFVFAYLMDPLVRFISLKARLKRNLSILIALFLLLGAITLFGAILIPSIIQSASDIVVKIEKYFTSQYTIDLLDNYIRNTDNEIILEVATYINDSLRDIVIKVGELSTDFINGLLGFIASMSSGVFNFFMALIISIYMLVDKNDLLNRVKRLNYAINDKETADSLLKVMKNSDRVFSDFIIGKLLDSAILGLLCFIIMWLFKIPNSPAIGFVVGLTNIIPYFGPFIGAIPAVLVTLASGTLWQVFWVVVIIVTLQQFDGLYLGPKILGNKVGVGPFWIIVSVSVGGAFFGIVGMFAGVPVVVILKTLLEEFVENRLKTKNIDL